MADNLGNLSITGYRYCYKNQWDDGSYVSLKSAYSGTNNSGVSVCVDKITLPEFTNAKYKQPFTITYKPSILLGTADSSTSGTLKAYLCSSDPCGSRYASNTATAPSSYIGSGSVNYSGLTQNHQYFPVDITVSSTDLTSKGTYYIWIYTTSFTQVHYDAKVTGTISGTLQTYTVSYDANGGSGAPDSQTKTYGTTLTLRSNEPTRTGYTFKGWAKSKTATTADYQPSGSYTDNAGTTLYAVWEVNKYTLNIDLDGGTWDGKTGSQTITIAYQGTKSISVPTKTGYTFGGWAWTVYGSMNNSWSNSVLSSSSHNISVYNNNDNDVVTHTYVSNASDKDKYSNDYITIKKTSSTAAQPGLGGFSRTRTPELNTTYYHTFYAKLPTGYYFSRHQNTMPTGTTYEWLTDTKGTGAWKLYSYKMVTGSSGETTKTFGYIAANADSGSSTATVTWYLGANQITKSPTTAQTFTAGAGDTWMYALWIPNKYTVTYDSNGGSGSIAADTVYYGSSYTTKSNSFKRTGYSFSGWNTKSDGKGTSYNAESSISNISADITLYAQWTANTGKVTIEGSNYGTVKDANGNSIASGNSMSYGTVLTITPTAATGYTTTAKVSTGSISNNKYTVNSDVTITFTRTENTYYVYYENGLATSGTLPNTTSRTYTKNATIGTNNMSKTSTTEDSYTVTYNKGTSTSGTVPEKQTSTNTTTYTKNGWTTSSSNTNDPDYANGATYGANTTNNLTLYPNFSTSVTNSGVTLKTNSMAKSTTTDATYTITYNANNGSVNPSSDTAYKKTSYAANGWTTTSGSSTRTYANNANTGALSTNLTLYPCFTPTTTTDSLNLPTPTRSNYTFSGWYTSASGGSQITSPYTPTQTRTLYAHWSINQHTVTFDPNGGTSSDNLSKTVNAGSQIGTLPTVTRDGYTFNGWYTSTTGGSKISTTTTISSDKTYYARWTANKYTVVFDSNGGTGTMSNQSFTYGTSQALRANTFTRTGYIFSGWSYNGNTYTDKESVNNLTTVNNGTVTMVAIWKLAVYNLTIKSNGGILLSNNTTNDIVTKFAYGIRTYVGKRTESISYSLNTGSNNSINKTYSSGTTLYYSDSYVDPNTNGGKLELLNPTRLTSISQNNCNNYLKGKYILFNNEMYLISSTASFTGTSTTSRKLVCTSAALCSISENISYNWESNNAAEKENYIFTGYSASAGSVYRNTSGASFYFDGEGENSWDSWESSSESYVFDGNATEDVTITAQFRKKNYTVQYELNNSKITDQSSFSEVHDYGDTFTLPSFTTTQIYEFLGWNTEADGSGTTYDIGSEVSNLSDVDGATFTLYAQWKLKNLVQVHHGGKFENAQMFVWTNNQWTLATTYVWKSGDWAMSTGK